MFSKFVSSRSRSKKLIDDSIEISGEKDISGDLRSGESESSNVEEKISSAPIEM